MQPGISQRGGEERVSVFVPFVKPGIGFLTRIVWSGAVTTKSREDQFYAVRQRFMDLHIWIKLFGFVADQGKDAVGLNKGLLGRIQRSLNITFFHVEGDLHVVNLMLVNACHAVFGKPKQDSVLQTLYLVSSLEKVTRNCSAPL